MGRVWAGLERRGKREDSRQTGSAVPGGAQPSKPPCVWGVPAPRTLPAGGAIGRGCDGGTAAVTSLAVGTRRTRVLPSPRGKGFAWRRGQVDFLRGVDVRGVVAG